MVKGMILCIILAVFILASGCIQSSAMQQTSDSNKMVRLESQNKLLQERIAGLEMQVGVYKSIQDCKEKALIAFIDKNTIVQQTTLKDAFGRCDSVFSALKALAER